MILVRAGDRMRAFPMQPPGIPCLLKIEGTELWAECVGCRFGADGHPIAGPCTAPLLAALLAWGLTVWTSHVPVYLVPPPSRIFAVL
jgi:hypothetical protein